MSLFQGGGSFGSTVNAGYASGVNSPGGNLNPVNWLTGGQATLDALANRYILSNQGGSTINGFVFDYEAVTRISFESEITDHYSESNYPFQDHSAHRPLRVELTGFVGEIVYNAGTGVSGVLNTLQNKLTQLPGILGKYTPGVIQTMQKAVNSATNVLNQVDSAISKVQNFVGLFTGASSANTKQAKAFAQLYEAWNGGTPGGQMFNLTTPFTPSGKAIQNLMIERVELVQNEQTKYWADIRVILKQIRLVQVQQGPLNSQNSQVATINNSGRAALQRQSQTNKGTTPGATVSLSSLTSYSGFA
jgi:Dit-like phage tail protein